MTDTEKPETYQPPTPTPLFTPTTDIMAIQLASRIPEFWADQPRVWFIRTEAILAPQKLSDDSRFDMVVSKLPKDIITQISDFLSNPPASGKFNAIKIKLLSLLEDSKARQIEKLISEMELGDQKPSQLLRRMRDLARDKIPDDTLRVLWQGHLPSTVKAVLAVTDTKDLENLASVADNVAEATRSSQVAAITTTSNTTNEIALLRAEIAKLNIRVLNAERSRPRYRNFHQYRRYSSRSSSRHRNNSSQRPQRSSPGNLCFYHEKYKEKAHKCVQPCAWNNKATTPAQPEN